jgi:hypothetical protein
MPKRDLHLLAVARLVGAVVHYVVLTPDEATPVFASYVR